MTSPSAADLIESYIARLRTELTSVGAAEADDLAAEVRSMLADAAGDDPDRATAEIAALGEPAELAAGILAERGLSPEGAMSSAEWWRMGIAVPIDITIGVSVPVAAFLPFYLAFAAPVRPDAAVLIALSALLLGALVWPWYVWRPWRTGGSSATAGMAIMGISVVRAPGFWRVVRTEDLAALGLTPARRSRLTAAIPILFAIALVAWSLQASGQYLSGSGVRGATEPLVGSEAEQRKAVDEVVRKLYEAIGDGDPVAAASLATADAGLLAIQDRDAIDPQASFDIVDARLVSPGIWSVQVAVTGMAGATYTDTLTVNLSLVTREEGYEARWVVTEILGAGAACETGT